MLFFKTYLTRLFLLSSKVSASPGSIAKLQSSPIGNFQLILDSSLNLQHGSFH